MKIAVVTGSCGLVGSEAVGYLIKKGFNVIGIDNDARRYFFGRGASTAWMRKRLAKLGKSYQHLAVDIRNHPALKKIFSRHAKNIKLILHTAAQPSHDWAAREPLTDFSINAVGTLNLLECTRQYCPQAVFIFTSTNKVYGDLPNTLPLKEKKTRLDLPSGHKFYKGIDETMSIDQSTHSLFGASKAAADILVQEYGRYFGMKTGVFRGGCLTGPNHSGAVLHGFLSYLMYACVSGTAYNVYGYKGKQVRDNIHSNDLMEAFYQFYKKPRRGEVYNIGGGRQNNCSVLEAITMCEEISGKKIKYKVLKANRVGDHQWYITDLRKFKKHYPSWKQRYGLRETLVEIYEKNLVRWKRH